MADEPSTDFDYALLESEIACRVLAAETFDDERYLDPEETPRLRLLWCTGNDFDLVDPPPGDAVIVRDWTGNENHALLSAPAGPYFPDGAAAVDFTNDGGSAAGGPTEWYYGDPLPDGWVIRIEGDDYVAQICQFQPPED